MRRRENGSLYGALLILAIAIGGALYVYYSVMFERDVPAISMKNSGYWNLKDSLDVAIDDISGLKSYKVSLKSDTSETVLYEEQFMEAHESVRVKIDPPKSSYAMSDKNIKIVVEARDASKWNLFKGNITRSEFALKIDKKRPLVNIILNSYKINKGGAALVIFKVEDENLKNVYIETNFGKKFIAQPFYKEGYYISLLAWPITSVDFKATVIADDYALNSTQAYVPLYLQDKIYKVSNIKIDDNFLKGKIAELADEFEETQGITDPIKQFKIINEDVRIKNEKLIHEITSKVSDKMINDFKINSMYPLKNGQVVAHYGDHRIYSYNGEDISESYHMGLDLASNAIADIKTQNSGNVVFSEYNGLYGNMPIIDHGLGLYTLYGHCSTVNVNNGDTVNEDATIANTGKSGYAMGDHLHFGVLVQGIEVYPAEWMDNNWMKLNITDVISGAKDIIDKKI
ncbi:MAG: peptidase M23 [Sulfurimonas sp. RIFCSPLOWO2_12_FULL_36_74]|uniref:M23 family metallopeptidase n=1 Tax=Sulfurimonas sp. RIFCSPLOWO2_12_36_12 TaxID=1802253 RepID=UPI0008ACF1C3|nr:M23 family metallopeptidase [Sulfurimonas sp. RIFCSPLOWO2_12_36_12]OHD97457.1 MAG: peptidase M23 [Sulfurimonas sp. RIFCSPLOWO2_02_FULL_36_28]OHE00076.1 MAG: peptidase M23 [Sulfurimonas sp. RIFCSPLOWO2_12_36_12]OHE08411.1 MAG: peptidase M23 [Sulfurimonas sp. RIFCSPLOWO2_12_FULL_36_74]